MKLIIAGSRTLSPSIQLIEGLISQFNVPQVTEVVSGKAKGVDDAGERWAKHKGIPVGDNPAKWDDLDTPGAIIKTTKSGKKYNAKAGHDRNAIMARKGGGLLLIWDGVSRGSLSMKTEMNKYSSKPIYECILRRIHDR